MDDVKRIVLTECDNARTAQLLAASGDLLDALVTLTDVCDALDYGARCDWPTEARYRRAVAAARVAIAKAGGRR